MIFLYAFLVGGAICVVGQLLLDVFKLTPAHVVVSFVVLGAFLDSFGLYDKLIINQVIGVVVRLTKEKDER